MTKFSNNISSVNYERKVELIERSKQVKIALNDFLLSRKIFNQHGITYQLGKAYVIYDNIYKERLTIEEQTILFLYIIFPNDLEFIKLISRHNANLEEIGKLYSIPTNFVKLRCRILKEMQEQKRLILKNNE